MNDLLGERFPREELRAGLAALAGEQIFVGTSSWKYEGWLGLLYTPERYLTGRKVSRPSASTPVSTNFRAPRCWTASSRRCRAISGCRSR
jgi:hypothetical protein